MKKKHSALTQMWKRRLCIAAAGALAAVLFPAMPLSAAEDNSVLKAGSIPVSAEKYSSDSPFNEEGDGTAGSRYFRIPAIVTLENGDLLATADARWETTSDGGGLDTIASVSSDGGNTWYYSFPFYFPDSDGYAGKNATTIIDPATLVGPDGTVYCFADVNPTGCTTLYKTIGTGTGYVTVQGKRYLALTKDYTNVDTEPSDTDLDTYPYYVGDFDENGYAKILNRKDSSETGYGVDEWYNLYTIDDSGNYKDNLKQKQVNNASVDIQQNAFYRDSDFHVYSIGYIWVITSKDNGRTWEHPQNINDQIKRHSGENAILVSPGKGITTSCGDLVVGYYDHGINGNEENASIGYSTDNGKTWKRTNDVTGSGNGGCWSSENEIVELEDGTLRMFFRSGTKHISYADAVKDPKTGDYTMGDPVITEQSSFSGCNVTALSYSKKINGKQAILVACPTDASSRSKGKIFTYLVEADKSLTLFSEFSVPQRKNNLFNYSCLTELQDGSIGLLWETAWNDIIYDHFSILDICPEADVSGVTVDVELEEGETYTRTCSVKGNITEQPNTEIASLTTTGGCITITGEKCGFTRTIIDGVMYRIQVESDSSEITLNEGDSQDFSKKTLTQGPSESDVISVEPYNRCITGMFDHTSNQASSLASFSSTENTGIHFSDAEFTFTASGTNWQIKNEKTNTYLTNASSAATFFSPTAANMSVTPVGSTGTFRICKENQERYVIFYFNEMNFNSNKDYKENYTDGCYELVLLQKSDNSGQDVIPGYQKASAITSGQKYLISYIDKEGSVFLLYPQNGVNNQTKLASHVEQGVLVTATAPGTAEVVIDDESYSFTVTDKTCSHSNTSVKNIIPVYCDKAGYTGDTICNDCGYVVARGFTLAPLGHNWDEGTVTKAVSENENGEILYTCRHDSFHTKREIIYSSAYTEFLEAYAKATGLVKNPGLYTTESFQELKEAYDTGTQVKADDKADSPAMYHCAETLCEAMDSLVQKPDNALSLKPGTTLTNASITPTPAVPAETTAVYKKMEFKVLDTAKKTAVLVKNENKTSQKLTIPASVPINGENYAVTQVGAKAFKGCGRLKQIVIGKNITAIKKQAFLGCKRLSRITVKGKNLKSIQADAFRKTASRITVAVPKKLKKAQRNTLLKKMVKGGMAKNYVMK